MRLTVDILRKSLDSATRYKICNAGQHRRTVPKDADYIQSEWAGCQQASAGGENSEIEKATDASPFLESASFSGPAIRKEA